MSVFSTTDRVLAVAARAAKMPEQGHIWTREQLGNLGQWILNQEKLHKNLKDLVKHHKLYPPKRTGEGLVIQDILYVDIVGIICDFMKCFPDFDPDKYESTDEHGECIRERCRDCSYLRNDWTTGCLYMTSRTMHVQSTRSKETDKDVQ